MSFEEKTYDLIEKYLKGTLTPEEAAWVKTLMETDNTFADEVEAHRMVNELIIDNALLDVKEELKNIHAEENRSKFRRQIYLSSILLAGLITAGLIIYNIRATDNGENEPVVEHTKMKEPILVPNDTFVKKEVDSAASIISGIEKIVAQNEKELAAETASPAQQDKTTTDATAKPNTTTAPPLTGGGITNTEKPNANTSTSGATAQSASTACEHVTIRPECTVDPVSGNLTIDTKLSEANPPYQFSVDGGKTYSDQHEFTSEGRTVYLVIVKDQKNCKSQLTEVKIPTHANYVIYPEQQKFLELPLSRFNGAAVNIKIMNARTGAIVFTAVADATNYVWEGVDQSNNPLAMGNYVYEVTSSRSSVTLTGMITIVR